MKKLYGMVCAMITPMRENGEIDLESTAVFCDYLAKAGVHSLYPNGTNGESLIVARQEREAVAETIRKTNAGRSVLYIQCGAMTVEETYSHVRHAKKIGADGAGIMTPAFFPIDDRMTTEYYDAILDELPDYPMYVYNIAFRTGNDVPSSVLGDLMARHPNLYGIKFSSADLKRLGEYTRCCPGREPGVLIGNDGLALCCLTSGGTGYVSGPGAVFPETYANMYNTYLKGGIAEAQEAQRKVQDLMGRMAGVPEIPAIKYMLWKKDVIKTPVCRRPFRKLDAAEKKQLDDLLVYASR